MPKALIGLIPVLILQGAGLVLLYKLANEPSKFGFILCGGVVGWLLFYFVRRFSVFSPKTLAATLAAFLGGEGLSWLVALRSTQPDVDIQYFTGLGVGFFLFLIYASFCAWMFAARIVDSPMKLELLVGCGAHNAEELLKIEKIIEFEELAKEWNAGKLSTETLKSRITNIGISKKELLDNAELGAELLEKLRAEGLVPS